jgi:hypothetical protein
MALAGVASDAVGWHRVAGFSHFSPKMSSLMNGQGDRTKDWSPGWGRLPSGKEATKGKTMWDVDGHVNRRFLVLWRVRMIDRVVRRRHAGGSQSDRGADSHIGRLCEVNGLG